MPNCRHTIRKGNLIKWKDLFRFSSCTIDRPATRRRTSSLTHAENIRSGALADQKFRAEEDVEPRRSTADMQYLYNDGDTSIS